MATLSQVGIPGIGTGILHPKAKNRFRVFFSGLGGGSASSATLPNDLSLQVITWTRPNWSTEEIQQDRYNARIFIAGKYNFEPCSMTIEDDITNRASQAITAQHEAQQRLVGATGPWLNSEATASGYKFGATFEQLDGNEVVVEQWKYEGCWISSIDYADMDYSTGEKVSINLTMRFDLVHQILMPAVTGSSIGGLNP